MVSPDESTSEIYNSHEEDRNDAVVKMKVLSSYPGPPKESDSQKALTQL